jgi:hypothetical protein
LRPQNPKRRQQTTAAALKAQRKAKEWSISINRNNAKQTAQKKAKEQAKRETALNREKFARLEAIKTRGGENNGPIEKSDEKKEETLEKDKNQDTEKTSGEETDNRNEVDEHTQIRQWPFDIHIT